MVGEDEGSLTLKRRISGRAGPLYVSAGVSVGLFERKILPSEVTAIGQGSRVRPRSSLRRSFHPLAPRWNRRHRTLFSGFAPGIVSIPLANSSRPVRTIQVLP